MFFEKKPRKPIMTLNVTALIDICALLIIFLIMGTVFGESSIFIPNGVVIPKSFSKETVENAPKVTITQSGVMSSIQNDPVPLEWFKEEVPRPEMLAFKEKTKSYVNKIPAAARKSGVLLNVIADQNAPYKDIFSVVRVFREAGFQSVLFVARGN